MRSFLGLSASVIVLVAAAFVYIESDPGGPTPSLEADVPSFIGRPAQARPIDAALRRPAKQHPYLARSGLNSMHNDAAQSDAYRWAGPLGRSPEVRTRQFHRLGGSCVSQSFDREGRMLGTCVGPFGVTLVARDPNSLDVIARKSITRWLPIGEQFSGGVYFHLDHEDKVLLATNDLVIQRWGLTGSGADVEWELVEGHDIAPFLDRASSGPHRIIDVMPDWNGDYWFITRAGVVGVLDRSGERGMAIALGAGSIREGIDNAIAVGKNGVFVVSNHAMYRFSRAADGSILTQWRAPYDRGSAPKRGTMGWGSGTTPTLIGDDYVAIGDNADGQIQIVVYAQEKRADDQQVCAVGVFESGLGATENSLSAVGNSLIVENNFGYEGPRNIPNSAPGIARIDVAEGRCRKIWENRDITSPSAVPKTSLANGLVYLYTRDEGNPPDLHAWYFTAIDFETGALVYKLLTGVGWKFNNHYGSITLSPDGTAYVGMMGGLVSVRDGGAGASAN